MKSAVGKTFKTIFIVLAAVLLIITAVLYFIDAPVVEEGQTPTVAQKIILLGKEYLGEILAACGVSAMGLLAVLVKLIYNSVKKSLLENQATSTLVSSLEQKYANSEKENVALRQAVTIMSKKQDITSTLLMTVFSLSELPVSVREQIHSAQTEYNALDAALQIAGQVVEAAKNTEENKEQPAKADETSKSEQNSSSEPSKPVLL